MVVCGHLAEDVMLAVAAVVHRPGCQASLRHTIAFVKILGSDSFKIR